MRGWCFFAIWIPLQCGDPNNARVMQPLWFLFHVGTLRWQWLHDHLFSSPMCGPYNGTGHESTLPPPPPRMQEVCRHFNGSRVWGCGVGRGHLATLILAHWGGHPKGMRHAAAWIAPRCGRDNTIFFLSARILPNAEKSEGRGYIATFICIPCGDPRRQGCTLLPPRCYEPEKAQVRWPIYCSPPWEPIIQRSRWSLSFLRNTGTPPLQGLSSQLDFL